MTSSYEDIPIDIHYNKLLDWLISRRHASTDWHKSLLVIRSRKAKALSDGEQLKKFDTLAELSQLDDSNINYFDACHVVEVLSKDERYGSLNVLRQYTNNFTKVWQELVDIYPKDGVHLAEAAQIILRNVNYEIPALRKQVSKIAQDQQECLKKQAECQRQAKLSEEKYAITCAQLGIEGRNPRAELVVLACDISSDLEAIEKQISKIRPAITFYGEFSKFLRKSKDLPAPFLPLVHYVIERGNTTVFEWRTGLVPDVILSPMELQSQGADLANAANEGGDIDWGDFGDANVPSDSTGFEVVSVDPEIAVEVIIEGSGETEGQCKSPEDPLVVSFGDQKKIAQGEDAVTIFEGFNTRTRLLDDLAEIEAFLSQRMDEMKLAEAGSQAYVETVAIDGAPKSVLSVNAGTLSDYLKLVVDVTSKLTSERLIHYFKIRSSDAYLTKLVTELERISRNNEKAKQLSTILGERYNELGNSIPNLTKQIDFLSRRTTALKTAVEQQISSKYNNRIVNLIGEVCQLSS